MNIEQMKQIVEGAPEGATHVEGLDNYHYWDLVNFRYHFRDGGWERQYAGIHPDKGFTSLSDLRTIIAQAEEIERLRSFITQYRYQIKGGEVMQRHIDEKVLQAPKGEGDE